MPIWTLESLNDVPIVVSIFLITSVDSATIAGYLLVDRFWEIRKRTSGANGS